MKDTNLRHEANQLSRTNHENIIKLYGICDHNGSAYLVISHAECGPLYNYLHGDEQNEYTMARAIDWMTQFTQVQSYSYQYICMVLWCIHFHL